MDLSQAPALWVMQMCLAISVKALEANGDVAKVDFGQGTVRELNVMSAEARDGEYVLVQAGYATQAIDRETAEETLRLWDEVFKFEQSTL